MEKFEVRDVSIILSLNPKIYPLDVIYSCAYLFTEKNYIVMDGNPEEEILVDITPKEKGQDLRKLAGEFSNELVNFGAYTVQVARNARLRDHLMHRVFGEVPHSFHQRTRQDTSGNEMKAAPQNAAAIGLESKTWKDGRKLHETNLHR